MPSMMEELAQTELLRDVPDTILEQVLAQGQPRDLEPGDILLSPERENHHVYLLLSGVLTVHFDTPDSPPIREVMPGFSVGEISILDDAMPSAYVIAKGPCRVFPLHRDLIQHLVTDNNPVARNLVLMLIQWMKANTQRIVKDRLKIWQLTDQANVDGLTSLYNRRWLDNAYARLLTQAINEQQPLSLLMIDVDHFKRYNDTQGHPGGDQALIALADVLKISVRPYDFPARYGGEEFLVLLPNTQLNDGMVIAERIRQNVAKKTVAYPDGTALPGMTVSIGLAVSHAGSTPESLLAAADEKLYLAKQGGRNCVRY